MKALKSPLAQRVMRAGIRPQPGVAFQFEGKTFLPVLIPVARSLGDTRESTPGVSSHSKAPDAPVTKE